MKANVIYLDNLNTTSDVIKDNLNLILNINEQQLLHYHEPEPGLFIAESPNVIERAILSGYEARFLLCEEKYIFPKLHPMLELLCHIPIYTSSLEQLNRLSGFHLTRGMIAVFKRRRLESPSILCSYHSRIAVLDNVMNPTNVGAIFRNAAALNMDAVFLTKGCSDPLYKRSSRVSMGTVFQIPWTFIEEMPTSFFKDHGFTTISMALTTDSISIKDPLLSSLDKFAIILGSEGYGSSHEIISSCDYRIMLPMSHGVDSLNVAAASAIAFWELGKK